jgi:hypothetical protein
MTERSDGMDVPLERLVGRLAASWRLRAIVLEQCGVMLATKCLRECAEEIEAAAQSREPNRTSWYRHEKDIERMEGALTKIACPTQTLNLLWWQEEARRALGLEPDTDGRWPAMPPNTSYPAHSAE